MRTKDRLAELRRASARAAPGEPGAGPPPEPAPAPTDRADEEMQLMFQEVEALYGWIREISDNSAVIKCLLTDPTFYTNKSLQERLDGVATQSNALGLKASGALRQLQARAAAARGRGVRARAARLLAAAARRLLADALCAQHELLRALQRDQLRLLRTQAAVANLTISDEEYQSLLDTKDVQLFVDDWSAETAEARRALRDVEARRDELARVEASLHSLRDLFATLAHVVAEQQDQIDSVEYYALQATEHVELGGKQLCDGCVKHKRANKKKLSLIICLVSGFLIVLLVLVLTI